MAVGGTVTASAEGVSFSDLGQCAQWKREAAEWAGSLGYFQGDEQGRFLPDQPMTRAMFVTVLYRMSGETQPDNITRPDIFGDVPGNAYYWDPALWSGVTGIVTGVPDGPYHTLFRPDERITREQAAVMLYRWARLQEGLDTDWFDSLYHFGDRESVSPWAREAVEWAVGAQVMQGTKAARSYEDGTLSPRASVTRAEAAAMLQRLAVEMESQKIPAPDPFQEPNSFTHGCGGGERTLEQLMDESTLVVVGTMTAKSDCFLKRMAQSYSLFHDFTFFPQETLRGEDVSEPLAIRVQGGVLGNMGVSMTSEPRLETDKEYLLFLAPWGERDGPYRVLGYLGAYERTGEGARYRNVNGDEIDLAAFRGEIASFNRERPVW